MKTMKISHRDSLKARLATLPRRKQLAFALLTLERVLPCLVPFSERTGFDVSVYMKAEAMVWSTLAHQKLPVEDTLASSLGQECLRSAPDTEHYTDELVSHALNAALSVVAVLEFIQRGSVDQILEITDLVRDSVDFYIGSFDDSLVTESGTAKLDSHPMLLAEQRLQMQDVDFLIALPPDFKADALKKRVTANGSLLPLTKEGGRRDEPDKDRRSGGDKGGKGTGKGTA
jgi:uncharacterized protein YjaG (DUF416 family)